MSGEQRMSYTASDGKSKFEFDLCPRSEGWRIYIRKQPRYGARSTESHITHRLTDGWRRYICWRGVIETNEQAQAVARLWAEKTTKYIATGRFF